VQQFLRQHSGAAWKRTGQGRAVPRIIHQSHGLLALEHTLICPAQHGGVARPAEAGHCLGAGHRAAPSPSEWVKAAENCECPRRLVASRPPIFCTMSDGEGPSAGEWQCYIYLPWLRLHSQGLRSPRTPGPPQAAGSCEAGPPFSYPDTWGPATWQGRLTFKAQFGRTPPGLSCGLQQEAVPATNTLRLTALGRGQG
jgi:hypothetical protein